MKVNQELIKRLIFEKTPGNLRFTQDSPIYPEVWLGYFENRENIDEHREDLILTPHRDFSTAVLYKEISQRLREFSGLETNPAWRLASSGETVAVCLTLKELIEVALPLTKWMQSYTFINGEPSSDFRWFKNLVGAIFHDENSKSTDFRDDFFSHLAIYPAKQRENPTVLWSVYKNRPASVSIDKSVPSTKGDAGRRVFDIDGSGIAWAVIDSGIDANHPAFRIVDEQTKKPSPNAFGKKTDPDSNHTRIVATYDFTKFREKLAWIHSNNTATKTKSFEKLFEVSGNSKDEGLKSLEIEGYISEIDESLSRGRMLDWSVIGPLLRVPHNSEEYIAPANAHGTNVAGILGAGQKDDPSGNNLTGMCPGIELYDFRVFDKEGNGEEFNILAAIQFIGYLNSEKEEQVIHGANMSFSLKHLVSSYACGQTPICIASNRLVSQGVVVVAAAGNLGQSVFLAEDGSQSQGFRMVNITDPGNAETVITVGATHRNKPHTYGISYFSSKGPTGDGRLKPDLVAPGEKIRSCGLDNGISHMDGTSMAAPHVSGAAALILAKHRELIGSPWKIKEAICKTATDLGRERYFQGAGMLDVLRAIQSI